MTTRLQLDPLRIEAIELRILGAAVVELRKFTLASPRPERLRRVALGGARGVGLELLHLPTRKGRAVFLGRALQVAVNLLRVRVTSGGRLTRRVLHWHGNSGNTAVAAFEVRILARYFGVPAIQVRAVHHGDSIAETRPRSTSRKNATIFAPIDTISRASLVVVNYRRRSLQSTVKIDRWLSHKETPHSQSIYLTPFSSPFPSLSLSHATVPSRLPAAIPRSSGPRMRTGRAQ